MGDSSKRGKRSTGMSIVLRRAGAGRRPARSWLRLTRWLAGLSLACLPSAAAAAGVFDFDDVIDRAKQLAARRFEEPERIPQWLLDISYDQWRDIRFKPEKSLWRDRNLPFEVQFFHAGVFYDRTVAINEIDASGVRAIPFSPSNFNYGKNEFASRVPQDLGYGGFRIHYPIKKADYRDEVIVFLGATYFRAVGRDHVFGTSARALSVDTALPSGEEFPFFRKFWLVRPTRTATDLMIYAIADSPSLTGAYRFAVIPGAQTVVQVDVRIFLRKPVKKLGIAPATSMFFFGEEALARFDDFRPEVHDSDGVLLNLASGEWLWRPLVNPNDLLVNAFKADDPKGFGLLQRDRNFDHYQDLETRQDLRPSVWITPQGSWGRGFLEVVEIPTRADYNDNVVTYWVPEDLPPPGQPVSLSYKMFWFTDDTARPPGGRTVATRRQTVVERGVHRFVVDFEGGELAQLGADTVLRAYVTVASGEGSAEIVEQQAYKNSVTGGWRLAFQVRPLGNDPVELRAFLDLAGEALTETWTYTLVP